MSDPGRWMRSPQRQAFFDDGFIYLRGALDGSAAREMENAIWSVLSRRGVHRDNRETWSPDSASRLQAVRKQDRPPAEIPAVRLVLDDLFGAGTWTRPRDWGQVLMTFPAAPPWSPRGGLWHLDHPFSLPGGTITGVNAFLFVADVGAGGRDVDPARVPRPGGTIRRRGRRGRRREDGRDATAVLRLAPGAAGDDAYVGTGPGAVHGQGLRHRRGAGEGRGADRQGGRHRGLPSLAAAHAFSERRRPAPDHARLENLPTATRTGR